MLYGFVLILSDFEIHPRRIERTVRQTLCIFADVTVCAILVRARRMTDLACEFVFVNRVLSICRVGQRLFVTVEARRLGLVEHGRARLPISVQRVFFVALSACHTEFCPVDIAVNAIVTAAIFIADARAVTCHAGVAQRCDFFDCVSGEQSAAGVRGATDVAIAAGSMASRAVISKSFFDGRRIHIRANCFQIGPVTVLCEMQSIGRVFHNGRMAISANLFWLCTWIARHALMRSILVRDFGVAAVTRSASQFPVSGFREFRIADKNFFPRLQRGQCCASALALRFF